MKKIVVSFFLLAVAFSCTDQMQVKSPNTVNRIEISEAQQHFAMQASTVNMAQPGKGEGLKRKHLAKNADWDNAFYLDLSFGHALIVSTKFDQELYYKPNQDVSIPISALTYFMFYKDSKSEVHLEVLTFLPSFDKK